MNGAADDVIGGGAAIVAPINTKHENEHT